MTDQLACIVLWDPAARRVLWGVTAADVWNGAFSSMSAGRIEIAGAADPASVRLRQ